MSEAPKEGWFGIPKVDNTLVAAALLTGAIGLAAGAAWEMFRTGALKLPALPGVQQAPQVIMDSGQQELQTLRAQVSTYQEAVANQQREMESLRQARTEPRLQEQQQQAPPAPTMPSYEMQEQAQIASTTKSMSGRSEVGTQETIIRQPTGHIDEIGRNSFRPTIQDQKPAAPGYRARFGNRVQV